VYFFEFAWVRVQVFKLNKLGLIGRRKIMLPWIAVFWLGFLIGFILMALLVVGKNNAA